jgi:hypothetical protein
MVLAFDSSPLAAEDDDEHEHEHDGDVSVGKTCRNKALYIRADQPTVEGFMRESLRFGIRVLCAVAGMVLLASCVGNPPTPTPATHKMVGTNSPGY